MYWSPVGEVPDIVWPLTVRKWSGVANQGLTTRVIVKDRVKTRVGFVSQPSGLFYIEGPFEARRGELVAALRALGVHVTGPDAGTLVGLPFDPEWRLWPSSANRVMLYGYAMPLSEDEVGPAGFVPRDEVDEVDDEDDEWAEPVVDDQGRPLDPDTHEVLAPHERAVFYWQNRSLDVAYEGDRPAAENLLRRAGHISVAETPLVFTNGMIEGRHKLWGWTPGEIAQPAQPDEDVWEEPHSHFHEDDPPASADPFAPAYRTALDDALAEACTAFVTGTWQRLSISTRERYPTASVSIDILPATDQDNEEIISCLLHSGTVARTDPEPPDGWRHPLTEGTNRDNILAIAGIWPEDEQGTAQELLDLIRSALTWAPAAPPALVEIELEPDEDTEPDEMRRMRCVESRRSMQIDEYESCVGKTAVASWHSENPIVIRRELTGNVFDASLLDDLDAAARAWLTPSEWEARDGHLDEWPGGLEELLERAAVADDEDEDDEQDEDGEDQNEGILSFNVSDLLASIMADDEDRDEWASIDGERLLTLLRRWAAREWIAGGDQVETALIAARGTAHPRRPDVSRLAEHLMQLAFLRRDADAVLHWGGEWISNTGYGSLAIPIKGYLAGLRAQGEKEFAQEIERRAKEVVPPHLMTFS